ncbi:MULTISPECIES: thioesterase II family protein [Bacillus]|uniref:Thioesterase domain-containing protein n=1 Tax=Bacillus cereus HuA3-9 TaxID=1053205 RepID=R8CWV9_BACCE|nr:MULTISPECIES: thioesterase domain-containing protein [Bacillus cereus group]EOO16134.1 hypothetical protein IGA_03664 [Bacillus cereus HuA3-9]MCU5327702.1 thioesterase domain-containing protein [Bacillus wiedmannii]WLP62665.1 thioesterase domain-containing protein [Bacillus thuringiensis]
MNKIKLFCLPFAGGSASIYMKWRPHLHPMIELIPIEIASRGARFNDDHYGSFDACIEDVLNQIKNYGIDTPYAIFGHSMGASISFEVTRKLELKYNSLPIRLFLSGRRSPQSARPFKQMHLLSDDEFIVELRKLGGTAEEILADSSLSEVFFPIIRADYEMLSSYKFQPPSQPINVAFSILNGKADDLYPQEITGWQALTTSKCEYLFFEGGHFYIEEKYKDVVSHVNSALITIENEVAR